jgi:hypothetical protein
MKIKQISVFAENKPGRLMAILSALDTAKVNLQAISVSETTEFGIVRIIMDQPEAGSEALRKAGFTERTDLLVSTEIPDTPSSLLKMVAVPLAGAGINISYFYAFLEHKTNKARIVLKTSDDNKAEEILTKG